MQPTQQHITKKSAPMSLYHQLPDYLCERYLRATGSTLTWLQERKHNQLVRHMEPIRTGHGVQYHLT